MGITGLNDCRWLNGVVLRVSTIDKTRDYSNLSFLIF